MSQYFQDRRFKQTGANEGESANNTARTLQKSSLLKMKQKPNCVESLFASCIPDGPRGQCVKKIKNGESRKEWKWGCQMKGNHPKCNNVPDHLLCEYKRSICVRCC